MANVVQKELLRLPVTLRSETWDPTPGAQGSIDFSADVMKQDAVVGAFKVVTFVPLRLTSNS